MNNEKEKSGEDNFNLNNPLNMLLTARKVVLISFITMGITIFSMLIHILYFNSVNNSILERVKERDILVLTNSGMLNGKTSPDFKLIAQQFAQVTFLSTLNYRNTDVLTQLNFMQIYSTKDIFEHYREMVQVKESEAKMEERLYYANINSKDGIEIETMVPNQKYKVSINGVRDVVSNFTNETKPVKLTVIIERDINTGVENIFGLRITAYNLESKQ
jgi:hypothetical protein